MEIIEVLYAPTGKELKALVACGGKIVSQAGNPPRHFLTFKSEELVSAYLERLLDIQIVCYAWDEEIDKAPALQRQIDALAAHLWAPSNRLKTKPEITAGDPAPKETESGTDRS